MSTYINTNTTASMASLNLSTNNANESNDIEQLSTGLRINSAADDPAGLVVSEDNQAQLAGLNQATSNSNNAINETQTAESALNQVQNLLISMRALAVNASNSGVNDSTEVQADQTQIASAIQAINGIATTTQFGDKNLLDGSASSGMTTTPGAATASSAANFAVVSQGTWASNDTYTSASLSATTNASTTFALTTGGSPVTSADAEFSGSVGINGTTYNLSTTQPSSVADLNTAIAASGYTASVNGSGSLVFTANASGPVTAPVINASALSVDAGTEEATQVEGVGGANLGVLYFAALGTPPSGGLLAAAPSVTAATQEGISGTVSFTVGGTSFNETYAPGTSINQLQTDLNSTFGTTNGVNVTVDGSGNLSLVGTGTNAIGSGTFTDTGSFLMAYNTATPSATSTFQNGTTSNLTLQDAAGNTLASTSTQTINGTSYYTFDNGLVLSSAQAQTSAASTIAGSLATTAGATTTGTDLEYQLGANGGQTASLSIGSFAASQLGQGAASYTDADGNTQQVLTGSVADINVSTFKGAQDAMAVIDQAIDQVSTERANLGAFQTNVLQSNVTSLGVATTNLQSSEGTVEDADMASTVVNYTKDSILVQASTSALSYATQMPQEILKLLQ